MMASAFAPASVANVAVGFDLLGFSLPCMGDTVHVEKTTERVVAIEQIEGVCVDLPRDPRRNTATAGLVQLLEDQKLPFGLSLRIEKGIPIGSGLGGSAASAVAALVAANELLPQRLTRDELLQYVLLGEAQASGSFHADNAAPALYGGLVMSQVVDRTSVLPRVRTIELPTPSDIHCVAVLPKCRVETRSAREILKPHVEWSDHLMQKSLLAQFVSACYRGDIELLRECFQDVIVEPQRAHLIPGFYSVQKAAMTAGAIGCSISGSGPCLFAWASGLTSGQNVKEAMVRAFEQSGLEIFGAWCLPLERQGARVVS